jgi:glycosyltransferase involved in cell wall biosynthesis
MTPPLVSAILPAYNRLAHLRAAVDCIRRQTLHDWEAVIADDGSDTPTREYLDAISDSRVHVLRLEHSGNPAAVRNAAIAEARGRFLAFIDSDDLWVAEKLERQLAAMALHPARRWSYTQVRRIDAGGNEAPGEGVAPWRAIEADLVAALLRIEALVATPSVIAERELVLEAGGFDVQQRFCEDYDLWLRLAMRSPASAISEPLACVRVHQDNYSQDRLGAYTGWLRLYEKHARLLTEARHRRICRQRSADSALSLAALYRDAGQSTQAREAFAHALTRGWTQLRWWPRAARVLARGLVPRRART